jgi:hypothetical protein
MKTRMLLAAALTAIASHAGATNVDVGVSIGISQPGVYGRIDIGRFPQPQVIVAQPVIVSPPHVVVARPVEPVYMWVPPGHRKNWKRYCGEYRACGTPVVFVRDDWYDAQVRPHGRDRGYEREHGHGRDKGHGKGRRDD